MVKKAFTGTLSQVENCEVMSLSFPLLVLNASVEHALYQIIEANKKKTVSLSIKSKAVVGAVKKLASVFDKKMTQMGYRARVRETFCWPECLF